MVRDREHLALPVWREAAPARKRGGGGHRPRTDRSTRGLRILTQAEQLTEAFERRNERAPAGINPKLVFKIALAPDGTFDDVNVRRLNLHVLARSSDKAIVVFPTETSLIQLKQRVAEYAGLRPGGHQYAELDAIESIEELEAEDRLGSGLIARPFRDGEVGFVDIELWHPGSADEARRLLGEVREFLDSSGNALTDLYVGRSLCLGRARVDQAAVQRLITDIDYVKQVDRRPEPTFELMDIQRVEALNVTVEPPDMQSLPGVLVIDSGVAQAHPFLSPVLGDAQVFPDRTQSRIIGGADDGDSHTGGHGTSVAGIAVYGNVTACVERRVFKPTAALFSARVTDERGEYDDEELVEHQFNDAIEYFLTNYPSVKVINISLGNRNAIYADGAYQSRLAAVIDEIAYRERYREVVFVIAAGNYWPNEIDDEDILANYPRYLLESSQARLIDPATSAIALTVGGLSFGAGRKPGDADKYMERLVAGHSSWPSPFTRVGFGVGGAVKPEVVDFAGDWRFSDGRIRGEQPSSGGIPSTSKDFAPPDGRLLRMVAGTSFAAPKIANMAARLFHWFPEASSNLVRALIVDSARVPQERPEMLMSPENRDEDVLRVYGYGQPDFDNAAMSSDNEVVFAYQGEIGVDQFQLFEVPPLPPEFLALRGRGHLSVTLAYDPPTRHTRADSYYGVVINFKLYRNCTTDAVAARYRVATMSGELENDERDGHTAQLSTVDLQPRVSRRRAGTVQKGRVTISGSQWQYDGGPLILAVSCHRRWAPVDVSSQRFAVVVSVSHDNPVVDIYAHVRQYAREFSRARVRV